jgi:hypothetical protein
MIRSMITARALAQAPVDAQRLAGRRSHARLHQNVALSDRPARDDLEALARMAHVRAGVLAQALDERLQHVAAEQLEILGPLPRAGVPPITAQDETPEQAEIGTLVEHCEQMLAVNVRPVATLGEQLPDLFDQSLDHHLRRGGRRQAARRSSRQERAQQRDAGENQSSTTE